jgi:ABC-type enterochelin transport system permease subunit
MFFSLDVQQRLFVTYKSVNSDIVTMGNVHIVKLLAWVISELKCLMVWLERYVMLDMY